jgi:hypothetical protein
MLELGELPEGFSLVLREGGFDRFDNALMGRRIGINTEPAVMGGLGLRL